MHVVNGKKGFSSKLQNLDSKIQSIRSKCFVMSFKMQTYLLELYSRNRKNLLVQCIQYHGLEVENQLITV